VSYLFHPQSVHFPIALLLTATLFDILYLLRPREIFPTMSSYLTGLGLVGAVVAAALGFLDLTRQVALGVGTGVLIQHRLHSLLAYAATGFYLIAFVVRWRRGMRPWLYPFSVVGALLMVVTAYLGGEVRKIM